MILSKSEGLLKTHNLWAFWDGIPQEKKKEIINYYESHATFWDYKMLFNGELQGSYEHGSIDCLNTLFVLDDLDLCDYFFSKFIEYSPANYLMHSPWGEFWPTQMKNLIELLKRVLLNRKEESEINSLNERITYYTSLSQIDIYWKDAHFFLYNYSKKVYKHYLRGDCSIERFYNAFILDYNNLNVIEFSLLKTLNSNCKNGLIEQYLIYLEKQKEYNKCIKLISDVINTGWTNDFMKRLNRCKSKLEKEELKNGNQSKT